MPRKLSNTPFVVACIGICILMHAPDVTAAPADAPLPLAQAAVAMTLPDGFKASLFAGEPDVVQPIALTFDDRGRLWVAECLSYPTWQRDITKKGQDRIIVLEDEKGGGHFTKKTIFETDLNNVTGLEVGFGGVWVCSTPQLLFIPADINADQPAPKGSPQVVLDGWDLNAHHNAFNRLTWGPDGWLYGCNGILSKSLVGKPGTPTEQRVAINCGVWRYQPVTQKFEVVAHGTTNPWGLDFDEYGQIFITNCVIEHLWHIIPGGHYKRMFGEDMNPYSYGLLQTCADHIHWAGGDWTSSRGGFGAHSQAGGGHAHAGCMIYLGDNWPDQYRGSVFMCNIHGNRVNNDILEPKGSGFVARHGHDFLLANDIWFRGLNLAYGPDGGVYINDWCDTGECHNYTTVDRSNGRIFKVTYGQTKAQHPNLAAESDDALVRLTTAKNQWWTRHARRILEERASTGGLNSSAQAALQEILRDDSSVPHQLNALWTLYATGSATPQLLQQQLASKQEYLRAWAIQLATQNGSVSPEWVHILETLARSDPSPIVRLYVTSALQRLPLVQRWKIAEALASHVEDATDPNLPLMTWYGLEASVAADPARGIALIPALKLPILREYIARRASTPPDVKTLAALTVLLGETQDPAIQLDVARGVEAALHQEPQVAMPRGWPSVAEKLEASGSAELRGKALCLSMTFGDPSAFAAVRKTILDSSGDVVARQDALAALVLHHDPELAAILQKVLIDGTLSGPAMRALADCPGEQTPKLILSVYSGLMPADKRDAINTLASRTQWAAMLLDAVASGKVNRADVSAVVIRQLRSINDPDLNERLKSVWGLTRTTSDDKKNLIAKFKAVYTAEVIKQANVSNGRVVFNKTCAQCHMLFDSGGHVGPILTGAQRTNLEYLFENILDPSEIVAKEYLMVIVKTRDGRVINGIRVSETDTALTVRTPTEDVVIQKDQVEKKTVSNVSMMPEGLLEALNPNDCRDLIGYLGSPEQVSLGQ